MILYFVPLGSLPLPTVITIFFVSPLLITLLSVPFLGERIVTSILSVCMGLVGVLIIIPPAPLISRSRRWWCLARRCPTQRFRSGRAA